MSIAHPELIERLDALKCAHDLDPTNSGGNEIRAAFIAIAVDQLLTVYRELTGDSNDTH